MYIIIALILLLTSYNEKNLVHTKSFNLGEINFTDEFRDYIIVDSTLYAVSKDGFWVYAYDLNTKLITAKYGGKGAGPTELSAPVSSINKVNNEILVSTQDMWIIFFDRWLKMERRYFVKYNIHDVFLYSNGEYGACYSSFENISAIGFFNVGKFNNDFSQMVNMNIYEIDNSIDNIFLSRCYVATNNNFAYTISAGSHDLFISSKQSGKLIRKVGLKHNKSEIQYLERNVPDAMKKMFEGFKVKDYRTPLGSYINSITATDDYVLVQGGLNAEHGLRTIYIVSTIDYSQNTHFINKECSFVKLQEEFVYCVIKAGVSTIVRQYKYQ